MNVFNRKGQNMAEYSILIALVLAAAIGIKLYVQRGVQARVHDESDKIGAALTGATGWTDMGALPTANLQKQYEDTKMTKQATTQTVEDTQDYTLNKEGTTSQVTTKTTKEAAKDYEQHAKPDLNYQQ